MYTKQVDLNIVQQQGVFGAFDANLKELESSLDVSLTCRDGDVEIRGEDQEQVRIAADTLAVLRTMLGRGEVIDGFTVSRIIELVRTDDAAGTLNAMKDVIVVTQNGKPIKCRTIGQKAYVDALENSTVTICIGPAGTGKTYLAVAAAVAAFHRNEVERIVMSRPAIEAGEERLGFLPGDLQNKVDPYLRPLYDALDEILGHDRVQKYQENRTIEIAPLAYMRGRTLNSSLIIIDEAQNASLSTLKMALTRLGEGSRLVLTGDITQIDLPRRSDSGLETCAKLLENIEGITTIRLTNKDVVRHKLVKDIVKAFDKYEETRRMSRDRSSPRR
ncbi:MAG: PhoH family protein [Oscillospiraceae bacterium]|nr:PhoH family protein [Oscillospiraceae bacterium]